MCGAPGTLLQRQVNVRGFAYLLKKKLGTRYGHFPVEVIELTNVTSNVNGWLSVQDGGTWRSDADNQLDLNISGRPAGVFLSCLPRLYPGLWTFVSPVLFSPT